MGLEFKTAKKRAADKNKPLTFTLDGDEYTFTPPKASTLAVAALSGDEEDTSGQIRALFDWLGNGMPAVQKDRLIGRLKDAKDDFDINDLVEVFKGLVEEAYGRPTT